MKDDLASHLYLVKVSHHGFADIYFNNSTGQQLFIATTSFEKHSTITAFAAGIKQTRPTRYTIQLNDNEHIELLPHFLRYINHSCEPNAFFDTGVMQLVAIQNIYPGDEVTFFYPSCEWEITAPFTCCCGSSRCLGNILGAAYLPESAAQQYRFTNFIQGKQHVTKM